ncbi:adenylyl-sulfate kinase [Paenibacillus sp. SC116]|uniref:adenylyl-sulfate kinase n=1 Tax=Paenibacillus sp. SC116 TaxID=2968986 RepID=UPI00215A57A4|nr:adenylyl-sulfate kinase [Paenibacillus sp. SC116]MCR8844120.1 adenylyl-sulfate kinase [Paenibacillus sp. SC116]
MSSENHLRWHSASINKAERELLNGHQGGVIWFTGLSGSGKSTLANAMAKFLYQQGVRTYVLDGDNIRLGLNRDLGFSPIDRTENIRRIAEVSRLFADAGLIVINAFISPYQTDRTMARQISSEHPYIEIYTCCSLAECERRDPKGLYVKARSGQISNFTGISAPYEEPQDAEITIMTEMESVAEAVGRITAELKVRHII